MTRSIKYKGYIFKIVENNYSHCSDECYFDGHRTDHSAHSTGSYLTYNYKDYNISEIYLDDAYKKLKKLLKINKR